MTTLNGTPDAIPALAGVGLKPQHFTRILETCPEIAWFEVHPENYMGAGGPMHHYLTRIRERYPLSLHSVGLSLGSADGVCPAQLDALKSLIDRYQPALVSDHLSWGRWQQFALNDLLPLPYTDESLSVLCRNIDQAQTVLQRQLLIENPSSYFEAVDTTYAENEFLIALARQSGARLLLDVNNVYVSACNHGFNAAAYIKSIPPALVGEIHLAGHSVQAIEGREIRVDDHGSKVQDAVWALYELTLTHTGKVPTLIEWDTDVPAWQVLLEQAQQADAVLAALDSPLALGVC